MNEEIKQCFDFDNSFIEPNWDLRNCFVEEEIKLTKREPTWNYILNIIALYSLMTKEENKKIKETIQEYNDAGEYIYKLKDNWNKLKEWLEEYIENIKMQYQNSEPIRQYSLKVIIDTLQVTINKMQEIEGGMNE